MVWDLGASDVRDFVTEGNVPVLLFRKKERRVQFLFKMFDAKPYEKKKMSEEEIKELYQSKLKWEHWYEPVAHWEHTVIENGKFSAVACAGAKCTCCETNAGAKDKGVTDNKMLPFPMRKRFALPVWVYDLEQVLYIKQAQQYFEEVGAYVDKHGNDVDFGVYKTGAGLDTRYHLIFIGKADLVSVETMLPNELDFIAPENKDFQEWAEEDDPANVRGTTVTPEGGIESDMEIGKKAGAFVIDFGDYKDKTLKEIWDSGDKEFLNFLVMKTDGVVKKKAEEFLKEMEAEDIPF